MIKRRITYFAATLLWGLVLWLPACVAAAGAIAQSFETSSNNISSGVLLSLVSTNQNMVEPASTATNLVGVAVDRPLVQLSSGGKNRVQVAVGGTTPALVSDMNGPVKAGDKITASPVSGVGMKATSSTEVVGTAQQALSAVSTVTKTVAGQHGNDVTVRVGLLPVAVNVSYYSSAPSGVIASLVPPFLQTVANNVAGHYVSPLRVLLGTAVMLLGSIAVITMLYVSIRSGLMSIGRNPLAETAIRRNIINMVMAAVGVLVITVVMVYVILAL